MKILVLSFYYPPDLSAGSFRTSALVQALLRRLGSTDSVYVLTTLPNRYATYRSEAMPEEDDGRLRITRIALPPHRSGFRDQAMAFARFAREVLKRTGGDSFDVVYATSSRLMTAWLGAVVAERLKARLHLDIRDLFTDNMSTILPAPAKWVIVPVLKAVEWWTFRRADSLSIVSPGFSGHMRRVCPNLVSTVRTNGIDEEFLNFDYRRPTNDPLLILYAGNIGEGQGLERVIPKAAEILGDRYRFRIIGDGGRRAALQAALEIGKQSSSSFSSVELLAPVSRKELQEHYAQADVLFLHLNDYPVFENVLPSKLFEYAATSKPILAGVSGVARALVVEHLHNAEVFRPSDAHGLAAGLSRLRLEMTSRPAFIAAFRRQQIMDALVGDILSTLGKAHVVTHPLANSADR